MNRNPLGQSVLQPQRYDPQQLFAIDRADGRTQAGIAGALPFHGTDIWTAYELTWLDRNGKPVVATATFTVPAASPRMVESKSMKLYLNSLAMSTYRDPQQVAALLEHDLGDAAGTAVRVQLFTAAMQSTAILDDLPGRCIDGIDVHCDTYAPDAALLETGSDTVSESLHSHVLRSNCPVTGQPDIGSVLINYTGPRIDAGSLLRYLASFRLHSGFHEACVERMFCDLKARCDPAQLTVYARYNRRGGIDINPFRSDFEEPPENLRLWRQ